MIWSNGDQLEKIVLSKAFQQGLSFVETIRIKERKLCYLHQHLTRLYSGLSDFELKAAWDMDRVELALQSFISQGATVNGRGRLQTFDREGLHYLVMVVDDFYYDPVEILGSGWSLEVSDDRRPSGDRRYLYKTNQYLSALITQKKHPRADEILFLNDKGYVTEGTRTNLFFIKDNRVYTPDVSNNLLSGIMRQEVTEILRVNGFEFYTGCYTIEDIADAETIFVTNALLPVAYIATFKGKAYAPFNQKFIKVFENL